MKYALFTMVRTKMGAGSPKADYTSTMIKKYLNSRVVSIT